MGVFRNRFVVDRIYIGTVGLKLATAMMFSSAMAIRNLERTDYRESLSRIVGGRVFKSGECAANIAPPRWARFEESLTAGWRASDAEIPVRSVRGQWKRRQRVHGLGLKQATNQYIEKKRTRWQEADPEKGERASANITLAIPRSRSRNWSRARGLCRRKIVDLK